MKRRRIKPFVVSSLALCAWLSAGGVVYNGASAEEEEVYTVVCAEDARGGGQCQVDKKTFVGWRTYHAFCHQCHAQDAVGSTFAPSLVERLKDIDKERFLNVVENGYTGQIGVMPAWKDNPNITKRYEELYAYLKARSDGALPPGRPKRLPKTAAQ
jgi:cytochrome c5